MVKSVANQTINQKRAEVMQDLKQFAVSKFEMNDTIKKIYCSNTCVTASNNELVSWFQNIQYFRLNDFKDANESVKKAGIYLLGK